MPEAPPRLVPVAAPSFYLTGRQPLRPGVLLLAAALAACVLSVIMLGLNQRAKGHFRQGEERASRSSGSSSSTHADDEDKDDDPSQVDTIVLGDAADAPVPARKHGRISNVHATVIVQLPRFGAQTGLIPDSPAGHLLYAWLAAFNGSSESGLGTTLPNRASGVASSAQLDLLHQTGGFNLVSAREIQPGVLVFRLRDQTPDGIEALGTLQVRTNSSPASIASLSLRSIPPAQHAQPSQTGPAPGTATPAGK